MTTPATVSADAVVRRAKDVIEAPLDDALIFMNIEVGQYFMLETTARDIWDMIDGARSIDDIVGLLTEKYDVEEAVCRAEVIAFVEALRDQKMVVPAE